LVTAMLTLVLNVGSRAYVRSRRNALDIDDDRKGFHYVPKPDTRAYVQNPDTSSANSDYDIIYWLSSVYDVYICSEQGQSKNWDY